MKLGNSMNWIEINLPFFTFGSLNFEEQIPDVSADAKAALGYCNADLLVESNTFDRSYDDNSLYEFACDYLDDFKEKSDLFPDDFVQEKIINHPNPVVAKLFFYRRKRNALTAWEGQHPALLAYWARYEAAEKAYKEAERQKSFCGRNLNVPGTLIEIQSGDTTKQMLIGDINCSGGQYSSEGDEIEGETMVLRYRVIWDGK